MYKHIHITGSSGFLGMNLIKNLKGFYLTGSSRIFNECLDFQHHKIDWSNKTSRNYKFEKKIDVIVNCSGLAHTPETKKNKNNYYAINCDGAINALMCAHLNGAKKFIQISTISVYDTSANDVFIDKTTKENPTTHYGKSKLEADLRLQEEARKLNIDLVIIRPAMIIGTPLKGNLRSLIKYLHTGMPFLYSKIENRKSYIEIRSLIRLIEISITNKNAAGKIFLAASKNTISTRNAARAIRRGLKKNHIEIALPGYILKLLKKTKFYSFWNKLFGNLVINVEYTEDILQWDADSDLSYAFRNCAKQFASKILNV